jgi:hypothetical protein
MRNGRFCAAVLTVLAGLVVSGPAHAAMLGLTKHAPDITSGLVKVSYTSSNATFTSTGTSASFDIDNVAPPDYSGANFTAGSFTLSMTVNIATGAPTGGTVTINGKVPALGATTGSLLTGNITAFGFPTGGGQTFDFLFNITGGDLASYWNATGHPGGMILDMGSPGTGAIAFTGVFTSDFRNTSGALGNGVSDAFITPEPAAAFGIVFISAMRVVSLRPAGRSKRAQRP